jgi:hypothetical protein
MRMKIHIRQSLICLEGRRNREIIIFLKCELISFIKDVSRLYFNRGGGIDHH